jgi:hypothetical protein
MRCEAATLLGAGYFVFFRFPEKARKTPGIELQSAIVPDIGSDDFFSDNYRA